MSCQMSCEENWSYLLLESSVTRCITSKFKEEITLKLRIVTSHMYLSEKNWEIKFELLKNFGPRYLHIAVKTKATAHVALNTERTVSYFGVFCVWSAV